MQITDIFFIPTKGVVVIGDVEDTFKDEFTTGKRVKIMRPDGTYVLSSINGIEKFSTVSGLRKIGILLDAVIVKEDVPSGSVITTLNFQ